MEENNTQKGTAAMHSLKMTRFACHSSYFTMSSVFCLPPLLCFAPYFGHGLWALFCYAWLLLALLLYLLHYDNSTLLQFVYCAFFTLLLSAGISIPVQTRQLEGGQWLIIFTFAGCWAADTCAQMCGRMFGKHKLGIGVSPNKTIEGCVGSLICTAAVYGLLGFAINRLAGTTFRIPLLVLSGFAVSLAAQVGDLLASAVKRCFGVKDFSRLIPGHGGMYDRFDSFALVAPMVYLMADLLPLFA